MYRMKARSRIRSKRTRTTLVFVCLVVCLSLATGLAAQWRYGAPKFKAFVTTIPVPLPTATPLPLAKEYIYAGSKLIATEESKSDQTITFATISTKTYGNAPFTLNATASSSLPITFIVVSGAITLAGSTVTLTGAGSVTIRAEQAGDPAYNPALSVTQSFSVAKAAATITLSSLSQTYNGAARFASATTNPAGLTVNLTYSLGGSAVSSPTNVGNYAVSALINNANYQGTASGTLIISKGTPSISWSNPSDIAETTALGTTQLNASVTVAGSLVYSPVAGTVLGIGNSQVLLVTFNPNDAANYNGASATRNINVIGCPRSFRSSFAPNTSPILPGNQSTLSWNVPYASVITLAGVSGQFNSIGNFSVTPSITTTYSLTAIGANLCSPLALQTQIAVCPTVGASQFSVDRDLIGLGASTTLSWNVPNATSVSISSLGTVSSSGSATVTPTTTSTYTLTANGVSGCTGISLQKTVTVQNCPTAAGSTFSASSQSITVGDSTTLNWNAPNTTGLSIRRQGACPQSTPKCNAGLVTDGSVTSGSISVTPDVTTTYVMEGEGAFGCSIFQKLVTVQVFGTPGNCSPGAYFQMDVSDIGPAHCPQAGADISMSWSVPDATSVTITDASGTNYGTYGSTGSISVSPLSTTAYTLTAHTAATNACSTFTITTTVEVCGAVG